VIEPFGEVI